MAGGEMKNVYVTTEEKLDKVIKEAAISIEKCRHCMAFRSCDLEKDLINDTYYPYHFEKCPESIKKWLLGNSK